jgi:hypothetical protein
VMWLSSCHRCQCQCETFFETNIAKHYQLVEYWLVLRFIASCLVGEGEHACSNHIRLADVQEKLKFPYLCPVYTLTWQNLGMFEFTVGDNL